MNDHPANSITNSVANSPTAEPRPENASAVAGGPTTKAAHVSGQVPTLRTGSSLYYALRTYSPQVQADVALLLRVMDTLASVAIEVQEPSVLDQKIYWWRDELERLHFHPAQVRHPLLVQMASLVERSSIDPRELVIFLDLAKEAKLTDCADNASFQDRLNRDYGARLNLASALWSTGEHGSDSHQRQVAPEWVNAFGNFDLLRRYRYLTYHGYSVFPLSDYTAADLQPDFESIKADTAGLKRLLEKRVEFTLASFAAAEADERARLPERALMVLAALRSRQLRLWAKAPERVFDQYQALTPLVKAWVSLRTRT